MRKAEAESAAEPEAVFIPEGAEQDREKVDDPADAAEADGQQVENAGADLADVKAMDAQPAEEEAQGQRSHRFLGEVIASTLAAGVWLALVLVLLMMMVGCWGCCAGWAAG